MPQPLDAVTHSELVFGVGSGANTDSKFSRNSADCSLDPQQVTQISVAPFIERTGQANSRLDRSDSPRPGQSFRSSTVRSSFQSLVIRSQAAMGV